jgi:hypothetical protein
LRRRRVQTCLGLAVPRLEPFDLDLDREAGQVAACLLGELRAHLDADDGEAALEQRTGRLAGPRADLQQPVAGLEVGQRDEVVEQLIRVRGPRRVVKTRRHLEGVPERLPPLVHCGSLAESS